MKRILIIQTAFIGDVILATPLIEKLHALYPEAKIDFLLRKGNEALLIHHPKINEILIWDKKKKKYRNFFKLIFSIRSRSYSMVVNVQRFFSTGMMTVLSGAGYTLGFDKNPLSVFFSKKVKHLIKENIHEIQRNLLLLTDNIDNQYFRPVLYPSQEDMEVVSFYKKQPYICIAPASVWFTKQYPAERWVELIDTLSFDGNIYLLGGSEDSSFCENIIKSTYHKHIKNLAGSLSLLQSAALMKGAVLNFVNDSAPLHLASAVNANICAIFCSTIPAFGFGPVSDFSYVVEVREALSCRPCGLHGYGSCPQRHFKCAYDIDNQRYNKILEKALAKSE